MKKLVLAAMLFPAAIQAADTQWALQQSTISYFVSHPLHKIHGVSKSARGKGACHQGECDFLIAVPVASFDSGDSNRDLHMLQVTRGGEFPLVQVRTRVPESAASSSMVLLDLDIEFAGQTAHFKQVPFQLKKHGQEIEATGTIPATLSDFKIEPPKLLTVPVKNEMPIDVDTIWRRE